MINHNNPEHMISIEPKSTSSHIRHYQACWTTIKIIINHDKPQWTIMINSHKPLLPKIYPNLYPNHSPHHYPCCPSLVALLPPRRAAPPPFAPRVRRGLFLRLDDSPYTVGDLQNHYSTDCTKLCPGRTTCRTPCSFVWKLTRNAALPVIKH